MSDTFNFPCWQTTNGPSVGSGSSVFIIPFGSFGQFTEAITVIGSVMWVGGYSEISTSNPFNEQFISTFGISSGANPKFSVGVTEDTGSPGDPQYIRFCIRDSNAAYTRRVDVYFSEEHNVTPVQPDTWYQFAASAQQSGGTVTVSAMVNGGTTGVGITSGLTAGGFNLEDGSVRWWHFGNARSPGGTPSTAANNADYPNVLVGPMAFHNAYIDLTDSTVTGRIFDADGNFKNPGQNGSLWFGDTYGATVPTQFMNDGTPRHQRGSHTYTWTYDNVSSGQGAPRGLRKDHE